MNPISVVLADDHHIVRNGIKMLVEGTEIQIIGEASNGNEAIEAVQNLNPDVVMMDIEMPRVSGIEGLKTIKKVFPKLNVLMQTSFEDDDKVFAAICAGASGYILKNTLPARILESIVEVYQGGSPMSPTVARKVLGFLQTPPAVVAKEIPNYNLSNREKEVLSCLVSGMSYKMIADHCHISYETVRSHMKNIYEKLHVVSMTEAVAKAINQGLV